MARSSTRRKRPRGTVEELPSGTLRVKVYAGFDSVTKRRHYLRETVPVGPNSEREAEKVLPVVVSSAHCVGPTSTPVERFSR
ncbi:hypothetical protein [Saccharopolyspora sp. NPDC049357]|uniref:hypothetical protein n=1 Tax=Saccharopolyspora sp. NPDC049357 TaxID=3154507 RepID=UPI0034382F14